MDEQCSLSVILGAPAGVTRSSLNSFVNSIVGVQVVGMADNLVSTLEMLGQSHADILLLDFNMLLQQLENHEIQMDWLLGLRGQFPGVRVILLANTIREVDDALRCGINDAFLKGLLADSLRKSIQSIGYTPVPKSISPALIPARPVN